MSPAKAQPNSFKVSMISLEHQLEHQLEEQLIEKLRALKYTYLDDIRDYAALKKNFREKFEALNRVSITDGEFERLLDEIITPDVFTASQTLRNRNSFTRDDGTPLNQTLASIVDWRRSTPAMSRSSNCAQGHI